MHFRFITALFILTIGAFSGLQAQEIFPVNGVHNPDHTTYAFIHAHIYVSPETVYKDATLVVANGKILACGTQATVPLDAVVYDMKGKYIYPSFIELNSDYGVPEVKPSERSHFSRPQYDSDKKGPYYWNEAVHPESVAAEYYKASETEASAWRKAGFGLVLTHKHDGVVRGSAALVTLNTDKPAGNVVRLDAAAVYSFNKGSSTQVYPSSLMGSIALLRQYFYDLQWYAGHQHDFQNQSLQSGTQLLPLPAIFETNGYLNALRANKIAEEFDRKFILIGGGDEYKRIHEIRASGASWIVPLNFPDAIDVSDPLDAVYVSLDVMKHWEMAPANPGIMEVVHIPFALTASRNKSKSEFTKNLRKAVRYGLSESAALRALTTEPAIMLGLHNEVGTLEAGKMANFFIADKNYFKENGSLLENWVAGQRHIIEDATGPEPSGEYNFNIGGVLYELTIEKTKKGYKALTTMGAEKGEKQAGSCVLEGDLLTIVFKKGNSKNPGPLRLVGKINFHQKIIDGKVEDGKGVWVNWTAVKQANVESDKPDTLPMPQIGVVYFPDKAFGDTLIPKQKNYFIDDVTIWTSDSTGRFKGDVIVRNGKIAEVGKVLFPSDDMVIVDGEGLHLTPGIIDEHTHIAISGGGNESGKAVSAEVRIGDVVNPDDINIYRLLAGGVTTVQVLHGSANPIGGQSAIIKLKWGKPADSLKMKDAPGFIKFALGENVKQSNAPPQFNVRFPQSRMGVEQVYMDAFSRARAYGEAWKNYDSIAHRDKRKIFNKQHPLPPRRDLELDALVEILDTTRYITCHSYVQSEINMLLHIGDTFDFRVNTFTHILEGYKVADKLRAHGAFASTFSDWWAYKYEVNDAIPYNAAILTEQGVVTAINSDDAEMGRRLNQEAAKGVKYGGMSQIEALKMVTINPAMMLHIDDRTGSITVGKDADMVLWNTNPLSVYAHPIFTMIEGTVYYSAARNISLLQLVKEERIRLINKMILEKQNGAKTRKPAPVHRKVYHCDTLEEETDF